MPCIARQHLGQVVQPCGDIGAAKKRSAATFMRPKQPSLDLSVNGRPAEAGGLAQVGDGEKDAVRVGCRHAASIKPRLARSPPNVKQPRSLRLPEASELFFLTTLVSHNPRAGAARLPRLNFTGKGPLMSDLAYWSSTCLAASIN